MLFCTPTARAPRRPRPDLHDWARQRALRGARSMRSRRWSSARRWSPSPPIWARSGGMITGDSQLRWVGPEKGVIHLATAAIVNAVWDLYAKAEGKPLWKLLVGYDAGRAGPLHRFPLHHRRAHAGRSAGNPAAATPRPKPQREAEMLRDGYPAYTTSAGLAGLSRRQNAPALPRSAGRRLDAFQDQSRRRY